MFTGLSTVATRRVPPRLGLPWAKAVRTPGAVMVPTPAAAPASHSRRLRPMGASGRWVPLISLIAGSSRRLRRRWSRLHHGRHAVQRAHVLQRVAVHRDQVGALAGLQRADLGVDAAGLGSPAGPGQQRVGRRDAQPHQRLQLERQAAVHGVGPDREADAGGEVAGEVLGHDPARPVQLVHDGRALAVAALDAGRVQEDPERADQPHAALDHERDVLVGGERAVLDGAHAFLHGQPQPGAAVGVSGRVAADAVGLLHRRPDLLARVGAGGRRGAG